jgi:glycosyltransferase involved in cell wall biosynthesis
MKIGLTIGTFYPKSGGLQAHAERLMQELQSRGHQVVIVTRAISRTPSFQDYFFFSETVTESTVKGLEVRVLGHHRRWNGLMWIVSKCIMRPRFYKFGIGLYNLLYLKSMLLALEGVDLIHHVGQAHELIGFTAATAARHLGIPFLIQPTAHPGQWGDTWLDFQLYQQAQRLLVHTEYEKNALQQSVDGIFDVVGNGIENRQDGEAEQFRKTHQISGPMILFLGRKETDKGYFLLKEAFALVQAQRSDVILVCIGPPARSSDLAETVEPREGLLELGFVQDQEKHDALAACTVLCVPSEGESFGLVYMEAARYAKPSVARRLPVLEELLNCKDAIVLVGAAHGNGNQVHLTPEELASALLTVLNAPALLRSLGENAYRVSDEFLWPQVVPRFELAYHLATKSLIKRSPSDDLDRKILLKH